MKPSLGSGRYDSRRYPSAEVVDTDVTAGPSEANLLVYLRDGRRFAAFRTCLEISRALRIPWELVRRGARRELVPVFKSSIINGAERRSNAHCVGSSALR